MFTVKLILVLLIVALAAVPSHLFCLAHAIKEYSIEVIPVSRRPFNPVPTTPTFITVNVTDIFGRTMNGSLAYSIDNGRSWQRASLDLIYGIPTNGTYKGTIPPLQTNDEVQYRFSFNDDIGYSGTLIDRFSYSKDIFQPEIGDPGIRVFSPTEQIRIRYRLSDYGLGIANSTIYYGMHSADLSQDKVQASLDTGDSWEGYYVAYLPAQTNGTSLLYRIEAMDVAGHLASKNGSFNVTYGISHLSLSTDLTSVDSSKLAATLRFTVQGIFSNNSFHNIQAGESDGRGFIVNSRIIPYSLYETSFNNNQNPTYSNVTLAGNPLKFPFDSYDINTVVVVPDKHIAIDNNSFHSNDLMRDNWSINGTRSSISIVGNETHIIREIKIGRNLFQMFGIMTPIVGGFFLLGATTILRNSTDELAVKMTIIIGLFALVFSITPLITDKKPFTYGLYTTADGLITALLTMNVLYAAFAIISYRYPKNNGRFEYLGFALGIPIVLLAIPFKWDEAWQLIALIVLGLGYGFITRPLWPRTKAGLRGHFMKNW